MTNVGKDHSFPIMIKNIEIFFGERGNIQRLWVLRFKPLFCQATLTNCLKVAEQVSLGVLQHPTKV